MLKATVMMIMKTIPTFITNIMWSAENLAPDAVATACAGGLATAFSECQHPTHLLVFPELRCEPDGAIVHEQKLKLASMNWLDWSAPQTLLSASQELRQNENDCL
jgi:hypothetical protein